jgi:hypothetical protein
MESVSWHELLAWVLLFLSAISSIVGWVAKLRWSKEYKDAKEAQIKMLEAQVKQLQDLTPKKLYDYVKFSAAILEEYNNQLEEEKKKLQNDFERSQSELKEAAEKGRLTGTRIDELEEQMKMLRTALDEKGNEIQRYHRFALTLPVRFKEAYGPVGGWFLLNKSRTEVAKDQNTSVKFISENADMPEAKELKSIEAEAWEEFLDQTIMQAIIWAKDSKK